VSRAVAARTIEVCPSVADRIVTIPIGVRIPARFPRRSASAGPLRLIYHGILKQHQKRVLDLPRVAQAAGDRGLPVQLPIRSTGGFRVEDMVKAYRAVFERAMAESRAGTFVRPKAPLSLPPMELAGVSLLPIALPHVEPDLGAFPSPGDAADYRDQIAAIGTG